MSTKRQRSNTLFEAARQVIPGGVNSPVRAFQSVGGTPIFFQSAEGPYLFDADDNRYIDYVLSFGPMILGHGNERVLEAIRSQLDRAVTFGAPTELEIELAEMICTIIPSIESVRMVNSGTEATMTAIRLARGYTGRDKIIKFQGCYHGHADSLLVKSGSGALSLGIPSSPGVPRSLADHTITLSYNNIEQVHSVMKELGNQVACIIVEPVAGNMNCVLPIAGFLETIRECCTLNGSLLIMDEVMTGFRVGLEGACGYYGIDADLICLGKVIGGGMPVGAFGGKQNIMDYIAPTGPVYQAGTLSGNPVAMASGLATLELISEAGFFEAIFKRAEDLVQGLEAMAKSAQIPLTSNQAGSMWGVFFSEEEKISFYDQVMNCDKKLFSKFFHGMLKEGVYIAPSSFEAGFMSSAHTEGDITYTLEAAERVFRKI